MIASDEPHVSEGTCSLAASLLSMCPSGSLQGPLVISAGSGCSSRKRSGQAKAKVHFPLEYATGYDEVRLGMSIFFPSPAKRTCVKGKQQARMPAPMTKRQQKEDMARLGEGSMENEFGTASAGIAERFSDSSTSVSSTLTIEEEHAPTLDQPQILCKAGSKVSSKADSSVWTAYDPLVAPTTASQRTWTTHSSEESERRCSPERALVSIPPLDISQPLNQLDVEDQTEDCDNSIFNLDAVSVKGTGHIFRGEDGALYMLRH